MMRTIVSLLSEQPIPNLLFIKHIGRSNDQHIFISTKVMEEKYKSVDIAQVLALSKDRYKVIIVEPYSPEDILLHLDLLIGETITKEWIINLTGGTKIMSQMVYTVFSEIKNSTIFYWPDTNDRILELFPYVKEVPITNTPLINLADYLLVHGYEFTYIEPERPKAEAEFIWKKLMKAGDSMLVPELNKAKKDDYVGENKSYLSGGWFEEFLFYKLQEKYNLQYNQIHLSVHIYPLNAKRTNVPNREIDVVYVHNHQLHLWEGKVYNASNLKGDKIPKDLFKLSSLRQMLGLKASANYAIASNVFGNKQRDDTLKDYCNTLRIFDIYDLKKLKSYF